MSFFSSLPLDLPQVSKSLLPKGPLNGHDNDTIFPIGIILCLVVLYAARYHSSPYRKLPPGPRGYPIIGNLLDLRSGLQLKFAEWRNNYGDVIYLNAAGQPIIVLNSHKVATDLLDRRATIYSDRPRNIVASDIICGGLHFPLAHYDDTYRRMRKAASDGFSRASVKRFHDRQTTEAILLACDCLVRPAQRYQHFQRAAASMILSIVYGHPAITSEKDSNVEAINDFIDRLSRAAYPGTYLVEFFTWMRHIPSSLAKWKRQAENWHKQDSAMFQGLLHVVEEKLAKGDDQEGLGATLIRDAEKNGLSSKERSWVAGSMYIAGAETTWSVMVWWTLAMIAFPETQARAQAELDAVVGRARLPTFADYSHLPYIRAMVKEIIRWGTVTPLGIPHRTTADDWYQGMFIPKGTICIPNVWLMNRDPEVYGENAAQFDPARHLDANGDIADTKDEGHVSFGFGRRDCVGRHVGNNSLFINIAVMLWAMKFERKKDVSGKPLPLDDVNDYGIVVRPAPFECEISPRFPEAPGLLAQERELRGL